MQTRRPLQTRGQGPKRSLEDSWPPSMTDILLQEFPLELEVLRRPLPGQASCFFNEGKRVWGKQQEEGLPLDQTVK